MLRIFAVLIYTVALSCNVPVFASGQSQRSLDYKGYHVQFADDAAPDIASIERQIDICENVSVPTRMRAFFHAVPISIVTKLKTGSPGGYNALSRDEKFGKIVLRSGTLDEHRPILLHELLHGVHAKLLPNGFNNAQIERFYHIALNRFPDEASAGGGGDYFRSNSKEFFAVTASIYLFGEIKRPPYTVVNIRTRMPAYANFLSTLFSAEPK